MKSHTYAFAARDLLAALVPPIGGLVLFAAVLRGLGGAGVLPEPLPLRDMDHAVLWHQIHSSRKPAALVLVGDSSCLMDVSARQLGDALGSTVRNLGTMSPLGLDGFGILAADAGAAAPDAVPTVVVLVHPEFLRRPVAEPRLASLFHSLRESPAVPGVSADPWERMLQETGIADFRDRIESRIRPAPLRGEFRRRHGFVRELIAAMDADGGGLVDPGRWVRAGSGALPPLELSPRLEAPARAFAGRLPAGTRIRVAVTPVPESLATPDEAERQRRAIETLCRWIGSGAQPIPGLPAVLPDADFASSTHLNESGRADFTRRLGEALRSVR